jgi:hypothetical protein
MSHARDGQWVLINWEMDFAVAGKDFIPVHSTISGWQNFWLTKHLKWK